MKITFSIRRQLLSTTLCVTAVLLCNSRQLPASPLHLASSEQSKSKLVSSNSLLKASVHLAQIALLGSPQESVAAIGSLREFGPMGLDALFLAGAQLGKDGSKRFTEALDAVGQQKDCQYSHLFWHTDLEQAKKAAAQTRKPILSLWMLGKLNEEYSCANSRFFRTILYSNLGVSEFLRDHFVLHWHSVRPAPRISIDFGDGRLLERTITGNSIHYVLDQQGNPIDALPGLYTPAAFLRELRRSLDFHHESKVAKPAEAPVGREAYHRGRLTEINSRIQQTLGREGRRYLREIPLEQTGIQPVKAEPTLAAALPRAVSKMAVEKPLVVALSPGPHQKTGEERNDFWLRLGKIFCDAAAIDTNSQALIRQKYSKSSNLDLPEVWGRILKNLQETVTADTYYNEFVLRPRIHEWFTGKQVKKQLSDLNEFVYTELFLTPSSDPWLGLAPRDIFSALPNEGLQTASPTRLP